MFDSQIVYTVPGLILEEMHERSLALDYNRCYRKPGSFSKRMQELYEEFLRGATDEEVARIRKNTRNSWRGAEMPIVPIMVHEHKNLQPCEPHMRVAVGGDYSFIIDLTMEDFDLIVRVNEQEE